MRALLLTGLLLLPATAFAAPLAVPDNRLTLPSQETFAARLAIARATADASLPDADHPHIHYTPSDSGFGLGPIRADGADTDGLGRRRGPKPRYRVEGVSILGGSVGGSVDGRGGMLSLHWSGGN